MAVWKMTRIQLHTRTDAPVERYFADRPYVTVDELLSDALADRLASMIDPRKAAITLPARGDLINVNADEAGIE